MEPIKQELFKQAVALARAGQRDEARRYFVQLAKEQPTNTKVLLWLVYTGKDVSFSERLLTRIAQLEPDNKALPTARQWLEGQKTASVTTEPPPAPIGQERQTLSPQFIVTQVAAPVPNFTLLETAVEQPYRDPPPPPPVLTYPAGKTAQNDIFTTLRTTFKVGGYIFYAILFYFIFFSSGNNFDRPNYTYSADSARYPAFALPRNFTGTELNISQSKCLENSTYLADMDVKPDELKVLNIETYCYSITAANQKTYLDYYNRLMLRNNWDFDDELSSDTENVWYSNLGEVAIEYVGENKVGGYQLKVGEGLLIIVVVKERGQNVAYNQSPPHKAAFASV